MKLDIKPSWSVDVENGKDWKRFRENDRLLVIDASNEREAREELKSRPELVGKKVRLQSFGFNNHVAFTLTV